MLLSTGSSVSWPSSLVLVSRPAPAYQSEWTQSPMCRVLYTLLCNSLWPLSPSWLCVLWVRLAAAAHPVQDVGTALKFPVGLLWGRMRPSKKRYGLQVHTALLKPSHLGGDFSVLIQKCLRMLGVAGMLSGREPGSRPLAFRGDDASVGQGSASPTAGAARGYGTL